MNITPEQARELLDGATPGPWEASYDEIYCATRLYERGEGDEIDDEDSWELARHAPDLAQTVAALRWEYGVEQATGVTQWFRSRPMAEAHAEVHGCFRLVRRLVGPNETADQETPND